MHFIDIVTIVLAGYSSYFQSHIMQIKQSGSLPQLGYGHTQAWHMR